MAIIYRFSWLHKNNKATINPNNEKDNKCLQYAVTVALIHEEIRKKILKITNIKYFINKYKWQGINFPSEKRWLEKDWDK